MPDGAQFVTELKLFIYQIYPHPFLNNTTYKVSCILLTDIKWSNPNSSPSS